MRKQMVLGYAEYTGSEVLRACENYEKSILERIEKEKEEYIEKVISLERKNFWGKIRVKFTREEAERKWEKDTSTYGTSRRELTEKYHSKDYDEVLAIKRAARKGVEKTFYIDAVFMGKWL